MSNKPHNTEKFIEPSVPHDDDEHRVLESDELNPVASPANERADAVRAGVLHAGEIHAGEDGSRKKWHVDVGVDVVASCGHKIGEVVDVRDDVVVVEKGFFIPEDVYVPKSAIAEVDEHHLKLNVSRDAIAHSDWDDDPDYGNDGDDRRVS